MERFVVTLALSALVASRSLHAAPAFADEEPSFPIASALGESRSAGDAPAAEAAYMTIAQWMAQSRTEPAVEPAAPNKPAAPPTELNKMTVPPYVIEPPDILAIEGIKLVPKAPQRLAVGDAVEIRVPGALPEFPINGEFAIDAGGYVSLGLAYGRYKLADLTVEEAQAHIREDLTRRFQLADADVVVSLASADDVQKIAGQHLVAMDGRVNLGVYGSVYVTGMTISEARAAIEKHLAKDFREPTVSVDVIGYNSKIYYIITKGAGLGDDVVRVPITGNETVLDAVAQMGGFTSLGMEKMWVVRPAANGVGEEATLPVDWDAIAKGTSVETNYQLFPGDRLYIEPKLRDQRRLPPRADRDSPYHLSDDVQYYAPQATAPTPGAVQPATYDGTPPSTRDVELRLHDIITVHVEDVPTFDDDAPTEFPIACVISEVLPNGRLRIDGQQSILSYNEEWTVRLSGQVHRRAVQPDRTVSSRLVADLDLTNRAVKVFTADGAEEVTADDVQVKFNVSILRDLSGELGKLGASREGGGPKFADSDTLLGAVEGLKKRSLVKVVADPSLVTAVGRPASLEIAGTAPPQNIEGAEPTGPVAIEVVPREICLKENGFHVKVEVGVTKGGDLQCKADIPLGETLIHALHDPQVTSDSPDPGQTYLVVTPEFVE